MLKYQARITSPLLSKLRKCVSNLLKGSHQVHLNKLQTIEYTTVTQYFLCSVIWYRIVCLMVTCVCV